MPVRTTLAFLALLLGAPAAEAATRLEIVKGSRHQVLERGALGVRITSDRPTTIRVTGAYVGRRTVRVRRARTIRLTLNARGRQALRSCGPVSVTVRAAGATATKRYARSRRYCRALPYRVGIGKRSIAVGENGSFAGQPVFLGGYGVGSPPISEGRAATGNLGRGPEVRAVALSDGRRTIALADVEAQGWFAAMKEGPGIVDVRREVHARTNGALDPQRVIVQSDHSHGGVDLIGVWGGAPLAYREHVAEQTVQAIVAAYESMRPAELRYGVAPGRDLLSNQFDYDAENATVDDDVRLLQAHGSDGRPFATILNFSAHATVLGSSNLKATGDWIQTANDQLERRFGGAAMTIVGTLGRTQPADRGCPDASLAKDSDAQHLCTLGAYSARVVDRAGQAAASASALGGDPIVDARSYLIKDVATNIPILGLDLAGEPLGVPIYRSVTPPWLTGIVLGTVTGSARIGDVLLSSIPGEAYPQMALKVRELVPGLRGYMTAGLSQDQLGYLIAPYRAYPEPIRRTIFNQRGDAISPIDNDNYAFNVSPTIGERVTCSLLRGAGELFGRGATPRDAHEACAPFLNDLLEQAGADVD